MSINVISVNLFSDEIVDLLWLHGGGMREKNTLHQQGHIFVIETTFWGRELWYFFQKWFFVIKMTKEQGKAKNDIERFLDKVNTTLFP